MNFTKISFWAHFIDFTQFFENFSQILKKLTCRKYKIQMKITFNFIKYIEVNFTQFLKSNYLNHHINSTIAYLSFILCNLKGKCDYQWVFSSVWYYKWKKINTSHKSLPTVMDFDEK